MLRVPAVLLASLLVLGACGDGPSAVPGSGPDARAVLDRPVGVTPTGDELAQLIDGLNRAGVAIFFASLGDDGRNAVISPLSIGLAFGMADVGATGRTASALTDLFGLPSSGAARWSAFGQLAEEVTTVGQAVVRVASRVFPDDDLDLAPGYEDAVADVFGVAVETLPLREAPDRSRRHINEYVADRTEDLIPELLPDGFLDGRSTMVLVNALYLDAVWAAPFGKYPTRDRAFTRLDGSTVTVPLMHQRELYGPAIVTDTYAATEIPYQGDELSMLVIVPRDGHFDDVQARLGDDLLDEIDTGATEGAVDLLLPSFETESDVDLRAVIERQLGIDDLFDVPGFDGIAPGIVLSEAVHTAVIEVDERGTQAAAATALGFGESGVEDPEIVVHADRPFLYLVRHRPTGAVLFLGRVTDPER